MLLQCEDAVCSSAAVPYCHQAFLRVNEAVESEENAKIARDTAIRREVELAREVEHLTKKLSSHKQEALEEFQTQQKTVLEQLSGRAEIAEDDAQRAKHQVAILGVWNLRAQAHSTHNPINN